MDTVIWLFHACTACVPELSTRDLGACFDSTASPCAPACSWTPSPWCHAGGWPGCVSAEASGGPTTDEATLKVLDSR